MMGKAKRLSGCAANFRVFQIKQNLRFRTSRKGQYDYAELGPRTSDGALVDKMPDIDEGAVAEFHPSSCAFNGPKVLENFKNVTRQGRL